MPPNKTVTVQNKINLLFKDDASLLRRAVLCGYYLALTDMREHGKVITVQQMHDMLKHLRRNAPQRVTHAARNELRVR